MKRACFRLDSSRGLAGPQRLVGSLVRVGPATLSVLLGLAAIAWSSQAQAQAQKPRASPSSEASDEYAWLARDRAMNEGATLGGGVGLLHTQHAQGGAVGQFRVGFTTEYYSGGFLCTSAFPCPNPRNVGASGAAVPGTLQTDTTDHIGGRLSLSMQVLPWLEPYLSTVAFANSNAANRPSLLQVLGDSTLGAKAHAAFGSVFSVGGGFELLLVNGTGAVGLAGGGTGAKFRALATTDFRGLAKPLPFRISANATYALDNSGRVVEPTEANRGTPITRIERFGLGINRVDHFDVAAGTEAFLGQETIRPFVEYHVAIPVNRQDYRCRPNNPSFDKCLANDKVAPGSLTLGGRFFPWKRGFNLLLALDVGVSGVTTFIEEVKPEGPWMLYLGAGWAFDTQERPAVIKERVVERAVAAVNPAGRKIRGFIHEEGKSGGVPGAVIAWDNHPDFTSLVSFPDGHFTTHEVDEGAYLFGIKAEGFKLGQCSTSVVRLATPQARPGDPLSKGEVQLDCALVALPRVGALVGRVRDAETSLPVLNATVKLVDASKRESTLTTDQNGAFRVPELPPGESQITVEADGYLGLTEKVEVKPLHDNSAELVVNKRPKIANVTLGKSEIFIKQQVQFAVDSAVILPESTALLAEIADVFGKNPRVKRVEVQGHTDTTGTPERNIPLSQERAAAVVAWLNAHGVGGDRMVATGYGQTKPLVPNVTAANRAKNRRVQFMITEQDAALPSVVGPKSKP